MYTTVNLDSKTKITEFSHRQLIKNSYRNMDENISWTFKPEIFNFQLKKTTSKGTTKRKKIKQKEILLDNEKTPKRINFENEFKTQIEELQKYVQSYLATYTPLQPTIELKNDFNLDSIINESISFPRFKGSNASENLIKIKLNEQQYIIPPLCKFFNYDIKDIYEIDDKFDLIILDPPWRNKCIRRLKKSKEKSSNAYEMLNNNCIKNIPIPKFLTLNGLVVIWCTNSYQHQQSILNDILPAWNLKLITKLYWIKINVNGQTICNFNSEFGKKQPFEVIFIACPENCQNTFQNLSNDKKEILISIPSLINSHKPPLIEILRDYLPTTKPNCLEIFARYLQPNFTSIGLEVLKLMDSRLYMNQGSNYSNT